MRCAFWKTTEKKKIIIRTTVPWIEWGLSLDFSFCFFFLINSDCYWWIKFVDGRGFRSSLCSLFLWSLQSFSSLTGLKSSLQSVNFLAHIHICILSIYECIRPMYVIKVSFSDGRDLWMINMEVYLRTFLLYVDDLESDFDS